MTQKELLYYEDAIGHMDSIIKIIDNAITNLTDEELVGFMKEEVNKQKELKQSLINTLKEASNG